MSILFDGASYLNLGTGQDYMRNVPGGTICAWVKCTNFSTTRSFCGFYGATGTTRAKVSVNSATGLVSPRANALDADATSSFNSTGALTAAVLAHVAATFDFSSKSGKVYINGALDSSGSFANMTAGNTSNTAADLAKIGSQEAGGSNFWLGELEDVRIYDRGLSAAEIKTIATMRGRDAIVYGLRRRFPLCELGHNVACTVNPDIVDVSIFNQYIASSSTGNKYQRRMAIAADRRR